MKKMIIAGALLFSGMAYADIDSDIASMIRYAGTAVRDHGVNVVRMTPGAVKVSYNYSTRRFTAVDTRLGCSFQATTKVSFKKLSTGHYWKVNEVAGTNTCIE